MCVHVCVHECAAYLSLSCAHSAPVAPQQVFCHLWTAGPAPGEDMTGNAAPWRLLPVTAPPSRDPPPQS